MNLKDILSISGESTLFKFIAQGKNAVIVENLESGRRLSAGAASKVSALDEIAIFTTGEDVPLSKVMDMLWEKENGGEVLSHKMPEADLREYFAGVLPEYDRDRVYTSDIRKVLHWYSILHKLNLLIKEEEKEEPDEEAEAHSGTDTSEAKPATKPKAKVVAKGEAKPKAKVVAKVEAKPKAKTAVKGEAKPAAKTEVKPTAKPKESKAPAAGGGKKKPAAGK